MKKSSSLVKIAALFLMIGTLSSCSAGVQMPSPKGNAVQLNNLDLIKKIATLSSLPQTSKIIQTDSKTTIKTDTKERKLEENVTIKATRNLSNLDFWLTENYEEKDNKGTAKAKVDGFENNSHTYFDIKRSSNLKFDESSANFSVDNGKYAIKKDLLSPYTLNIVLATYGLQVMEPSFTNVLANVSFDMMVALNNYNYSGLKFYEKGDSFSISLSADLKGIKKERSEIIDIFKLYYPLLKDEDVIKTLNYKAVLVYEKNTIVSAGVDYGFSSQEKIDGYTNKANQKLSVATKYINKAPNAVNAEKYELIGKPSDIKK